MLVGLFVLSEFVRKKENIKRMFEQTEAKFCRLCLQAIHDEDSRVIDETILEVLFVLLLELSAEEIGESVICDACFTKLFAAFQFKTICKDTEDTICPYVNSETAAPVDIRDIYLKERGKDHLSMIVDRKICRLCMQVVICKCVPLKEVDMEMTIRYIPEVNFSSVKEPVICSVCLDSMNTHTSFLNSCRDAEEKIQNIRNDATASVVRIKTEYIEIKSEANDENSDMFPCIPNAESGDSPGTYHSDGVNVSSFEAKRSSKVISHLLTHEDTPRTQMYRCDVSDRETGLERSSIEHQSGHNDPTGTQKYNSNAYAFATSCEGSVADRELEHEGSSKAQMYECDACSFKAKWKSPLIRHQLMHKDSSDVRMYTCDTCGFETKYRHNFVRHQLTHKDVSEIRMYRCETCDFSTKHKGSLADHRLTHEGTSKARRYKCDACDFRAKWKSKLIRHRLTHRPAPEARMYRCNVCDFESKSEHSVVAHLLSHKGVLDVQPYECDFATRTRRWDLLTSHRSKHEDASEAASKPRMYKCVTCDFAAKYKDHLAKHQLQHEDLSERQTYECDVCGFQTKQERVLMNHQLKHKDASEAQMYKPDPVAMKGNMTGILRTILQTPCESRNAQM